MTISLQYSRWTPCFVMQKDSSNILPRLGCRPMLIIYFRLSIVKRPFIPNAHYCLQRKLYFVKSIIPRSELHNIILLKINNASGATTGYHSYQCKGYGAVMRNEKSGDAIVPWPPYLMRSKTRRSTSAPKLSFVQVSRTIPPSQHRLKSSNKLQGLLHHDFKM